MTEKAKAVYDALDTLAKQFAENWKKYEKGALACRSADELTAWLNVEKQKLNEENAAAVKSYFRVMQEFKSSSPAEHLAVSADIDARLSKQFENLAKQHMDFERLMQQRIKNNDFSLGSRILNFFRS